MWQHYFMSSTKEPKYEGCNTKFNLNFMKNETLSQRPEVFC